MPEESEALKQARREHEAKMEQWRREQAAKLAAQPPSGLGTGRCSCGTLIKNSASCCERCHHESFNGC